MAASGYYTHRLSLAGLNTRGLDTPKLEELFESILEKGFHGISFSPYVAGQGPGTVLTEEQISARLGIVAPYVKWIRTFSCTEGNELIPAVAKGFGLKTMVGIWLGDDLEKNEEEIAKGIELAQAGLVDVMGVGNEVLLREDLTEDQLIEAIEKVKAACPGVQVGYVDAYFKFVDYPRVSEACDVILANCYPFWEGCPEPFALPYMKEMYQQAVKAAGGKPVIISETGWPSQGTAFEGSEPSYENAIRYFINSYQWAEEEDIDMIYFASFDEDWKVDKEGDVGAYWGLWDKDGKLKYV